MTLDTTSLGNVVRRLRDGLARHQREPADEQLRDGLILRFEFTYELSHKMLRRYLKEGAASADEIERVPFADLVRTGNARAYCGPNGRPGDAFAKCVPAQVTLTMPRLLRRSPPRSRHSSKK
jgi:Nucleotidyltransferase substrate binding protein like